MATGNIRPSEEPITVPDNDSPKQERPEHNVLEVTTTADNAKEIQTTQKRNLSTTHKQKGQLWPKGMSQEKQVQLRRT